MALHARSQTTDSIRAYTAFEQLADAQGFVVAFPSGAGGSWNAGGCCRPGSVQGTDLVAFLDEVIALARERATIDVDRIAVTGSSNGGMMALRYACERSAVIATAAVLAGPLMAPCAPENGVSVLVLHGDAKDGVVPLDGGFYDPTDVTFPPVSASLEPFRSTGSDVDLRVLPDAGHGWMTLEEHGLDATQAVWPRGRRIATRRAVGTPTSGMDLQYVQSWSLGLDLAVLAKTVTTVLRGRGAY